MTDPPPYLSRTSSGTASADPASGEAAHFRGLGPDIGAIVFLLGLALLPLAREILFGGVVFDGDIILQSVPVYSWYAEGLREGRIPIWTPEILGGFPLAFGQYGFFYPPDMLLFRILDASRAFHLSLSLHVALAGACTYWYCRVLGLRRVPSLFAAVAFQMGNEVLSWPANGFITRTLFLVPALLAVVELMLRGRLGYWILAAPIVAAGMLGGYAQIVLFALAVAGIYVVAGLAFQRDGRRKRGAAPTVLGLLGLGVAAGFGLAAVRILPTMAVTALSTRAEGMDLARSSTGSIEPWALAAGYLLPAIFDLPGWFSVRPDYLGFPALFLAALSGLGLAGKLRGTMLFHACLAAVSLILSLGTFTPLYGGLAQLPLFSYFRGPNRFSFLAALSIAVLSAYALDRRLSLDLVRRGIPRHATVAVGVIGSAVVVAGLALSLAFQMGRDPFSEAVRAASTAGGWDLLNLLRPRVGLPLLGIPLIPLAALLVARHRLSHGFLEWLALGLTAATLATLGWVQNDWVRPEKATQPPALAAALSQDRDYYRLFSWSPRISTFNVGGYYTGFVGYPPSREFEEDYLHQFIPPNLNMLVGISTVDGYEALQSRRQSLLASYMGSDRTDPAGFLDGGKVDEAARAGGLPDRLELLAAMNVRYLIHAFPLQDDRLEYVDEVTLRIYPHLDAWARVYLYRLRKAVPRAFLVPEGRIAGGEREVLETLRQGSADLRRQVLLEGLAQLPDGLPLSVEGSTVEISVYSEERVVLRAKTDGAGFLVLMDVSMPGWSATVDGRAAPIYPANFAGRGVLLEGAGDHEVVFSYRAPLLREGALVTAATLILLLLSLGPRRIRPFPYPR